MSPSLSTTLPKPITQGAVSPVNSQNRGSKTLAKAQLAQRGSSQQRTCRHMYFGVTDLGQFFREQGAGKIQHAVLLQAQ